MEKLQIGSSDLISGNQSVLINLATWDKDLIAKKINMFRVAIYNCLQVDFTYYSPNGKSSRRIEPYYLIFQWSNWYIWGWCTTRKDFRLFKLNRMDQMMLSREHFEKRAVQMPDLSNDAVFPGLIDVEIQFTEDCK